MRKSFKISAFIVASLFLIKTTHSFEKPAITKFKNPDNEKSIIFRKPSNNVNDILFNSLNRMVIYHRWQNKKNEMKKTIQLTQTTILPSVLTTMLPFIYYGYKTYLGKKPSFFQCAMASLGTGISTYAATSLKNFYSQKNSPKDPFWEKEQSPKDPLWGKNLFEKEQSHFLEIVGNKEEWNSDSSSCLFKNLSDKIESSTQSFQTENDLKLLDHYIIHIESKEVFSENKTLKKAVENLSVFYKLNNEKYSDLAK